MGVLIVLLSVNNPSFIEAIPLTILYILFIITLPKLVPKI